MEIKEENRRKAAKVKPAKGTAHEARRPEQEGLSQPKGAKVKRAKAATSKAQREAEAQKWIEKLMVDHPGWAEVVAGVRAEKVRLEASPTRVAEEVQEEAETVVEEVVSEEYREWVKKAIEAGRYQRESGKRRVWGIDRKIYHTLVSAVDKRTDRHIDRSVGDMKVKHRRRLPLDRRVRRGPRFIQGVYPFRRIESWRH